MQFLRNVFLGTYHHLEFAFRSRTNRAEQLVVKIFCELISHMPQQLRHSYPEENDDTFQGSHANNLRDPVISLINFALLKIC